MLHPYSPSAEKIPELLAEKVHNMEHEQQSILQHGTFPDDTTLHYTILHYTTLHYTYQDNLSL
jgi:hypothetical protein